MMNKLELTSRTARKARTRALIEVGKIVEQTGLLETFGVILDENLQKSPRMKEPVEALFKSLLMLRKKVRTDEICKNT